MLEPARALSPDAVISGVSPTPVRVAASLGANGTLISYNCTPVHFTRFKLRILTVVQSRVSLCN
jgi:hypothetical protein